MTEEWLYNPDYKAIAPITGDDLPLPGTTPQGTEDKPLETAYIGAVQAYEDKV